MMLLREDFFSASLLIVDDVDADVRLLECLLRGAGYARVSSMPRGAAAVDGSALEGHDLILLDLQEPGEDGFVVLQNLRSVGADCSALVVGMTTRPGPRLRALRGGATDTIGKPFDPLEVGIRVHNLLELKLLQKKLKSLMQVDEPSSEWYWEQNQNGDCNQVAGPVQDLLGLGLSTFMGTPGADDRGLWIEAQRVEFLARLATRQAFTGFAFSRVQADGSERHFCISGEPVFGSEQNCIGYRGVGRETRPAAHTQRHMRYVNGAEHSAAASAARAAVKPAVHLGD